MDIQAKIKVSFYKWISDKTYIKSYEKYADFSRRNGNYLGDVCFEFNEYEKITIQLISDNPDDYMEINRKKSSRLIREFLKEAGKL